MKDRTLEGTKVAIIAMDGVQPDELSAPRAALEQAGATTVLLAPKLGEIQATKHSEKAERFRVDEALADASPEEFDGVLLPGGALNADKLRMETAAREFVQEMERSGKPIAAICHAPWLLVSAGLVRGHRLTSYYTLQDDIRNAGGQWEDREVVVDRNWVSSREPKDIPAFNREMIALFAKARREVGTGRSS
ncbi:MAG: type 1 glutamine amidotransferase [Chloroflexi bacterium]|nr:MAG: type 1 glutamine amidotransferase [Chloroflexota bacterium]TMG69716.1 MAG: type 1 glutamine amidotransferase [Chloroflexota bacterium]